MVGAIVVSVSAAVSFFSLKASFVGRTLWTGTVEASGAKRMSHLAAGLCQQLIVGNATSLLICLWRSDFAFFTVWGSGVSFRVVKYGCAR